MTYTTTALKYIPKRPRICINWNPPFQTQIYLLKVPLNVNIVKQDLLNKKQFLNFFEVRSERKGGFQLILILGLLHMYFDAVVVKVETFLLLFRLSLAILWWKWTCLMFIHVNLSIDKYSVFNAMNFVYKIFLTFEKTINVI